MKVNTTPPHDIMDQKIDRYLPSGKGADVLRDLMSRSQEILTGHDVNQVRGDLGENPATSIWLWGQGKMPQLPRFREQFGLTGALVAAVDLVRGIATLIGWKVLDVPGATGYLDTDYAAKGAAAVEALDEYDLVAVHVEAPDEAGHNGDVDAKVAAIEQVDQHIVGPVLAKLRSFSDWKVLAVPDHPTPISKRTHTAEPPPFCLAGSNVPAGEAGGFSEQVAVSAALQIDPGYELMEYFIKR